jgi:L-lactate dehydrogenase (cytochrome)
LFHFFLAKMAVRGEFADPILFPVLRDELEVTMRMCGVTDLSQVHPGLVNTLDIDHLVPTTDDHPYAKWRPKSRI